MTRDHRAATRAIFIESVYRYAETALGTRALVDTVLDHRISGEHPADNYDCDYDPHNVFATSASAFHEFLGRRVIKEGCHRKDHGRSRGDYQHRPAAGLKSIEAQINKNQRD